MTTRPNPKPDLPRQPYELPPRTGREVKLPDPQEDNPGGGGRVKLPTDPAPTKPEREVKVPAPTPGAPGGVDAIA